MNVEVIAFRGVRYNPARVAGDYVIAPPYDIITPDMREALYRKSPYNIVRVDAGHDLPADSDNDNKYTRASGLLKSWLEEGILTRDEKPAYYAYRMEYNAGGIGKTLTGVFGLVRLVDLGQGVYPHEATHSKPKKDRLSLMTETVSNSSPIYSLYSLPAAKCQAVSGILSKAASGRPALSYIDRDGGKHRLWTVDSEPDIKNIKEALSGAPIFIADGHHRYETALEYRRIMREAEGNPKKDRPYDFVLMFLADINDPGITVLPTHRLVTLDVEQMIERIGERFAVERINNGTDVLAAIRGREHAFGLYDGSAHYTLSCRADCVAADSPPELKSLDVVVLHKVLLGSMLEVGGWGYEMDASVARRMVDEGEYDAAFFLNPTAVADVERVARAALRMPPKSTYFYPKVQTGFVLNDLQNF